MKNIIFNIEKITGYLNKYKSELSKLYSWNSNINALSELNVFTESEIRDHNNKCPYEKEIEIKKAINKKLSEAYKNKDFEFFNKLCLWIIKDWGGIKTSNDKTTISLIHQSMTTQKLDFNRIASMSKIKAFLYPQKDVIYDSRVAYSINWIILSEKAGQYYFPIPAGRNSRMSAFDLNVLIRLKNISNYNPDKIDELLNKKFVSNTDKNIFIDKKDAYTELRNLIAAINKELWKGNMEKEQNLYYTEMLLFSIADKQIFMDITKKCKLTI